ncbi:VirB5 protein [Cupriavidus basilensis OR16]|uniref:VirB5 protein n=1 Tax=Cupriavidus basilensis OR16 TaxID=1127483 RepID=H1RZU7_9BURK|nr:VirB5 protein [Cupriavidus basilensis]EHP44163.1 VirB5 protein [Cupriavidus basilensis OR16]
MTMKKNIAEHAIDALSATFAVHAQPLHSEGEKGLAQHTTILASSAGDGPTVLAVQIAERSQVLKKAIVALVVFASLSAAVPASASGIPTFDGATVAALAAQFQQLQQQYETLKNQYAAVTGSYGRGASGMAESVAAASVVPGSWQDVVAKQASGAYGTKQGAYEKLIKTMPQELFQDPKSQSATTYKMSSDAVRAAMAGGDTLYAEVQTHLKNLSTLAQQVDTTANIKDAQDLQNRIATENGLMQSAIAKLNVMNMNLQANMVNQMNQATSANEQFFRRQGR